MSMTASLDEHEQPVVGVHADAFSEPNTCSILFRFMGWFGWESGDSEVGRGCRVCCVAAPFDLGKFVFGAGEADLQAFDLAEPAFAFGFGYAGFEVVADLD